MASSRKENDSKPMPINQYFKASDSVEANGPSMVKIYVGPERALWILPENIICDRVPYFKGAFKGDFREGREKSTDLDKDDPVAFAYLVDRVFSESLSSLKSSLTDKLGDVQEDQQLLWCKIWVLADKLLRFDIASEVMEIYLLHMRTMKAARMSLGVDPPTVDPAAAVYLYENTSDSAPIRQVLFQTACDIYLSSPGLSTAAMKSWVESASSHPKFLFDIMAYIKKTFCPFPAGQHCTYASCAIHTSPPAASSS